MSRPRPALAVLASITLLLAVLSTTVAVSKETAGPVQLVVTAGPLAAEPIAHLLVSEVMTGGTSASDELIELYNPSAAALPLEGLEVIYVTATGGTTTRKASWAAGAGSLPSGAHLLIANAAGAFAGIADVTYTNGLAAPGGSVAIRILGASTAIDAVGWGTAANPWMEGMAAAAPAQGHSIERLPGGSGGSGQDTNENSADFVERTAPDPQSTAAPPIAVSTPQPTASHSAAETPVLTPVPTPSATADPTTTPTMPISPTPSATPLTPRLRHAQRDTGHVSVAHALIRVADHRGGPCPARRHIGPGGRCKPDRLRLQRWRRLPRRCDGRHRRDAHRWNVPTRHDPARPRRA